MPFYIKYVSSYNQGLKFKCNIQFYVYVHALSVSVITSDSNLSISSKVDVYGL